MSLDLTGKTALVTGATSGIGRETAFALAKLGAIVILGCRNVDAARQIAQEIREQVPGANIIVPGPLDLAQPASIHSFVNAYQQQGHHLHLLVNNAGAAYRREWYTDAGVAGLTQVNYHGPYTLTRLLEPVLLASKPSRVVNVASVEHRVGYIMDIKKFMFDGKQFLYSATKLGNVLFTYEHQRRLGALGIQSCAVDPGAVRSSIWKRAGPIMQWVANHLFAPNEDGCKTVVHAATDAWEPVSETTDTNKQPTTLRFYARGLFTSPLLTGISWQSAAINKPLFMLWRVVLSVHGMIDYPVRHLSGGLLASQTRLVPSSMQSYDQQLAADLWDLSADTAKVSSQPITT
ncbi:hypothetical protein ABBQ32_007864 [Trebouxia sp. C0010 RCD-2024]